MQRTAYLDMSFQAAETLSVYNMIDACRFKCFQLVDESNVVDKKRVGVGHDRLAAKRAEEIDEPVVQGRFENHIRISENPDARNAVRLALRESAARRGRIPESSPCGVAGFSEDDAGRKSKGVFYQIRQCVEQA